VTCPSVCFYNRERERERERYLIGPGALVEIVRAAIARNAALALGAAGWVERAKRFLGEG